MQKQNISANLIRAMEYLYDKEGGESRGLNDRVCEISCRYLDKTGEKIEYIFLYPVDFHAVKCTYEGRLCNCDMGFLQGRC